MADSPPESAFPTLEMLAAQRIQHMYEDEPLAGGYPNPANSYYRILEFIGRSKPLIVHGNQNAAQFGWMGAVSEEDVRRWIQRFYGISLREHRELENQHQQLLRLVDAARARGDPLDPDLLFDIRTYEEQLRARKVLLHGPYEGNNVETDATTGRTMIKKEISWHYNLNDHKVYALYIPRSSGTTGVLQAEPRSRKHRMFCNIGIMAISLLYFEDISEYSGDKRSETYELIKTRVSISGFKLGKNAGDQSWTQFHRGGIYRESLNFRWLAAKQWKRRMLRNQDLYMEQQLQTYVKLNHPELSVDQLGIGYLFSGSPVEGGWELFDPDSDCSVLYDLHLFDFDVNSLPPTFHWITDLAESFTNWKTRTTNPLNEFVQYYGMRGPANVPTPIGESNYGNSKKALEMLKKWMDANNIPLSPRQQHFYTKHHSDYSVETAHFTPERGGEAAYYGPNSGETCQIQ